MIRRRKAVRHLGYAWWYGCGWTWRGRFICRICYAPRLPQVLALLDADPDEEPTT